MNCKSENMDNKQRSSSDSSELGSLGDSQMGLCADMNTVMNNNGNEETYSCPICRTVNSDRYVENDFSVFSFFFILFYRKVK